MDFWDVELYEFMEEAGKYDPEFEFYQEFNDKLALLALDKVAMQSKAIATFISDSNIVSLFHLTPIANLESILKHGLMARSTLYDNDIDHVALDETRRDLIRDGLSLSLSRPNLSYAANKLNRNPRIDLAVISLDAHLLTSTPFISINRNASSSVANRIFRTQRDELVGLEGLTSLYNRNLLDNHDPEFDECVTYLRNRPDLPTFQDAEVMALATISPSWITRIFVPWQTSTNSNLILDRIRDRNLAPINQSSDCLRPWIVPNFIYKLRWNPE